MNTNNYNMENNNNNMDTDSDGYSTDGYLDYGRFSDDSKIDDIIEDENEYYEIDKQHNQYVIGLFALKNRRCILSVCVSTATFYKYNYDSIMNYCISNSPYYSSIEKLEILKIRIGRQGEYYVLIKTHWLKLIQRTWKKIYKKRQEQLFARRNCLSLKHFEIRGRYSEGLNSLISIRGMLNGLRNSGRK